MSICVDASPADLGSLKTILSAQGWNIANAQSGTEALRALAKGGVDRVLADLMMPDSGGLELCRRIKACPEVRHTPVVILLAAAERGYLGKVYEAGACDYVMKPIDPVEMVARVRSVFEDQRRD